MKQVGYFFIGMGVVLTIAQLFSLNLKGVWWESLFMLAGAFASLWLPANKKLLNLGLHWRIAIIIATMSTFVVVWLFFYAILPKQNYAMQVTLFTFGMLAFLFNYLAKRKSGV